MIDIRLLRDQPDNVKARLAARDPALVATVDEILHWDGLRRSAETNLQQIQADRNRLSKEIGKLRARKLDSSGLEADVKSRATEMEELGRAGEEYAARQRDLLLSLPNLPHDKIPPGRTAAENPLLRTWGEKPQIAEPQDHLAIATRLGLVDFERAAKVAGSGFVCFTGPGARLERALINFLLDLHTREGGYVEVAPPHLVRPEALIGTSQLPKFEDQLYRTSEDCLYLAPTAEVPVTNLHREEIVAELPIHYAAYTPCFRREAGSAGLGTRGLIRMHQFDKVELVKICAPESAAAELETLTADAEKVLQRLGLHYRVIELCAGDLGFGATRTYDIEVWAPGQGDYLE
ncbi:MAG: serine--tRNA ligase, partial [Terrimicrobiaceae bacterium]